MKGNYVVSSVAGLRFVRGVGVVVVLLFVISCDEVERHKILTFFFDGVPPLAAEFLDPNSAEYAIALQRQEEGGSRHPPGEKECTRCHGEAGMARLSTVGLTEPIPQLCYGCHEEFGEPVEYVHGPVGLGECLFCHQAHESSQPKLLHKQVPDLCFMCHEQENIKMIADHAQPRYFKCTNCHNGHGGSARYFLKEDWEAKAK